VQIDWTINVATLVSGMIAGGLAMFGAQRAVMKAMHEFDKRVAIIEASAHEQTAWRVQFETRMLNILEDVARITGLLEQRRS
jgi:hypothetical protein